MRRHLPVEHGDDAAKIRREDDVVVLEVVVDQRRPALGRAVLLEPRAEAVDLRDVVGARLLVALRPAAHLPLDVPLGFPRSARPTAFQSRLWISASVSQVASDTVRIVGASSTRPSGTFARRMTPRTRSIT